MQLSNNAAEELAGVGPTQSAGSVSRNNKLFILLIIALWAVLYVPGIFSPPLLDDADSIHAEAAREMLVRHDWVTLYINGLRYLEKAPLMYWGMDISYKLFGVSDWSARLPLTVGMLAVLLATYALGKRDIDERAGLYAAVALGLSIGPYIFTRILIPDILVGLWLALGFYFFLQGIHEKQPSRLSCWGLAVTAALNVLTKGLIGIVFPACIILVYLWMTSNLRQLLKMRLASSFLWFMAVAAPWHILAGLENPAAGQSRGFFWFYFVNEQFLRYLKKRFPLDYDTVPFWLFWAMIVLWLVPWSGFLFKGLGLVVRPLRQKMHDLEWNGKLALVLVWLAPPLGKLTAFQQAGARVRAIQMSMTRRDHLLLLAIIWALVILIFFSFSSRQEYYTIPALPGLALVIGAWLSDETATSDNNLRRAGRRVSAVLFSIAVPAFLAGLVILCYSQSVPPGTDLASALTKHPDEYALSFGHIFDLTPRAMGLFRVPLVLFAGSLLLGTAANWFLRRRGRPVAGNVALALMALTLLHSAHRGLEIFSPILSSKHLSDELARVYHPGEIIVVNGAYEDASTLNFYGHFQLHVLNTRTEGNLYYGSLFPDSPPDFEDDNSFAKLWQGKRRVFLWTEEDKLPAVVKSGPYFVTAQSGGKYILSNKGGNTEN
ncbi:MAG: glycosyltransferase family 39 protein [Candidatus Korobacteraceae bacterium]|jgi:4-amino-4-deoxy-L-arabinose transferase-like glycosyltransferase